jgi:hypothetical protein
MNRAMARCALHFLLAALFVVTSFVVLPVFGAAQPEVPKGDGSRLGTLHKAFYVLTDGDKTANSVLTLGVALELTKIFHQTFPKADEPWAIAEPSWSVDTLVKQCADDHEGTLGGVVITYYTGTGTHFYLLWQSETTTFYVNATVVSCTGKSGEGGNPTIVNVIQQTPGSGDTAWVVRRSQVSIPLLTLAAIGQLMSKSAGNSKATNLTLTALAGSLFSSAGSKDIPGYSVPLRLRYSSQHIGVDLVTSLWEMCKDVARADVKPGQRETLCRRLRFTKEDNDELMRRLGTAPAETH